MAELKSCLEKAGFGHVSTYIQSGNVFFADDSGSDELVLASKMVAAIKAAFHLSVKVVVISHDQMRRMAAQLPHGWGDDPTWKYNALFLLPPYDIDQIIKDIGILKPDIEAIAAGEGVIFQSVEFASFGRSTSGKLAANPVYQNMTVRNHNTFRKLLETLDKD